MWHCSLTKIKENVFSSHDLRSSVIREGEKESRLGPWCWEMALGLCSALKTAAGQSRMERRVSRSFLSDDTRILISLIFDKTSHFLCIFPFLIILTEVV